MKRGSTFVLKGVIVLIGLAVLSICIFVLPRIIGSVDTMGYDPILFGMYITAVPFFIALFEAYKLLNYIDKNKAFSELSINVLRKIKYCAIAIGTVYLVGMPYIFQVADKDDAPGVVAIGLVIIFASFVIAVFAAVLQSLIQNALELKSENDLTV